MMNNTVYGDNYGNVGGNNNTTINYFILGNASFIKRVNTEAGLSEQQWGLIFLDVINNCSDTIITQVEQGIRQRDRVIRVDMTSIYDYCGKLLYYNGVKSNEYIEEFVIRFFSTLVGLNGWNFDVEVVPIMSRTFYELTPEGKG